MVSMRERVLRGLAIVVGAVCAWLGAIEGAGPDQPPVEVLGATESASAAQALSLPVIEATSTVRGLPFLGGPSGSVNTTYAGKFWFTLPRP